MFPIFLWHFSSMLYYKKQEIIVVILENIKCLKYDLKKSLFQKFPHFKDISQELLLNYKIKSIKLEIGIFFLWHINTNCVYTLHQIIS